MLYRYLYCCLFIINHEIVHFLHCIHVSVLACTCEYIKQQYFILEVSVKSGIGAAPKKFFRGPSPTSGIYQRSQEDCYDDGGHQSKMENGLNETRCPPEIIFAWNVCMSVRVSTPEAINN